MRILRLRPQERRYFDWLDPFRRLDRLVLPHYFALVGVTGIEGKNDESPSALLVASMEDDRLVVEWLCVDPAQRYEGLGGEMLDKLFELAKKQGLSKVAVRILEKDELSELNTESELYFAEQCFDSEELLPGEWSAEMFKLLKGSFFKKNASDYPMAKTIREVSAGLLKDAIGKLWDDDKAWRLSDVPGEPGIYDPDLSSALVDEDEICGLFLVQRVGDICYPSFMYAESEQEFLALVLRSAGAAREVMSPDEEIRLIARSEECAAMAAKIFPGGKHESKMLVADLDEIDS